MNEEYTTLAIRTSDVWILRRILEGQINKLIEFHTLTPSHSDKTANEERQKTLTDWINQLPNV